MPHKVNPIDFENAEGNFGSPTRCSSTSPRSCRSPRMQRDLTDSTVLRNMGVGLATRCSHSTACAGLGKLAG